MPNTVKSTTPAKRAPRPRASAVRAVDPVALASVEKSAAKKAKASGTVSPITSARSRKASVGRLTNADDVIVLDEPSVDEVLAADKAAVLAEIAAAPPEVVSVPAGSEVVPDSAVRDLARVVVDPESGIARPVKTARGFDPAGLSEFVCSKCATAKPVKQFGTITGSGLRQTICRKCRDAK